MPRSGSRPSPSRFKTWRPGLRLANLKRFRTGETYAELKNPLMASVSWILYIVGLLPNLFE